MSLEAQQPYCPDLSKPPVLDPSESLQDANKITRTATVSVRLLMMQEGRERWRSARRGRTSRLDRDVILATYGLGVTRGRTIVGEVRCLRCRLCLGSHGQLGCGYCPKCNGKLEKAA